MVTDRRRWPIIQEDIGAAAAAGNLLHALALKLVLRNYILQHPRCDARCQSAMRLPERRSL